MEKRGQVALFVIIAIVIAGIVAVFLFYPRLQGTLTGASGDPAAYMRACMELELENSINTTMRNGGSYSPEHFAVYGGERIEYLCYTTENYKPCIVQQPLIVNHVESELKNRIEPRARECFEEAKEIARDNGFSVSGEGQGTLNVSIEPERIELLFAAPLVLTKEDTTQRFTSFSVRKESKAYDLLLTALSIIDFESTLGNSETTLYMQFYPDLNIGKLKRDGDTIYTLRNVVSNEEFRFATRSLVWPPGYGLAVRSPE